MYTNRNLVSLVIQLMNVEIKLLKLNQEGQLCVQEHLYVRREKPISTKAYITESHLKRSKMAESLRESSNQSAFVLEA